MTEDSTSSNDELIEGFHPDEFGYATWAELTPAFASGKLVHIAKSIDFKRVATAVENDDSAQVSAWMDAGVMHPVSDQQAENWTDNGPTMFRFLIRPPLVLIQQLPFEPSART